MTNPATSDIQVIPQYEMRCLLCSNAWGDMDAALNQYPTRCPECDSFKTEPCTDEMGNAQPRGWFQ